MIALIPLILGQVAQKVAPKVIDAVVDSLVQAPNVPVQQDSAAATRDALGPIISKITGAGKWAIGFGGAGTFFAGLSAICMALGNGETDPQAYYEAGYGIVTGAVTLFGLWKARRAAK
jgi:hypothetical protein